MTVYILIIKIIAPYKTFVKNYKDVQILKTVHFF